MPGYHNAIPGSGCTIRIAPSAPVAQGGFLQVGLPPHDTGHEALTPGVTSTFYSGILDLG